MVIPLSIKHKHNMKQTQASQRLRGISTLVVLRLANEHSCSSFLPVAELASFP